LGTQCRLINAGVAAVREAAKAHAHPMKVMLHIAQPENVLGWFDDATVAGVMDYDIIGISYYSKWSKYDLAGLGKVIAAAHKRYGADVWVVETAYPFTNDYGDTTPNLLGSDSARISRHPQRSGPLYGGSDQAGRGQWRQWRGYWAPDRVSTRCKTRQRVGLGKCRVVRHQEA
jgi:arabinogalactan endo-1,4-beta-galactosidase